MRWKHTSLLTRFVIQVEVHQPAVFCIHYSSFFINVEIMPGHSLANQENFEPLSVNFGFGLIDHGWGPEGIFLPHCSESGHQRCGNRFSWHNQIRLRCPHGRDGPHAFSLINHITAFSSRQQMASAKRVPTFCLRSFPPAPRSVPSRHVRKSSPSLFPPSTMNSPHHESTFDSPSA